MTVESSGIKWVMGMPAGKLADELDAILHGNEIGRLREIVFFLYRGDVNDALLFCLNDCLSKEMSINDYAMVQKLVRKLSKRINEI